MTGDHAMLRCACGRPYAAVADLARCQSRDHAAPEEVADLEAVVRAELHLERRTPIPPARLARLHAQAERAQGRPAGSA